LNAAIAILLIAVVAGIVGTYVVSRRMLFVTGGITHTSFGGLGLGMYLGFSPTITALIFALMSAFGIEMLSRGGRVREDSAIAVFWTLGMALGIIFVYITPGYNAGLTGFLFGDILTITRTDLWIYAIYVLLLMSLFLIFKKFRVF
jgi:zinc transport system permease protein